MGFHCDDARGRLAGTRGGTPLELTGGGANATNDHLFISFFWLWEPHQVLRRMAAKPDGEGATSFSTVLSWLETAFHA